MDSHRAVGRCVTLMAFAVLASSCSDHVPPGNASEPSPSRDELIDSAIGEYVSGESVDSSSEARVHREHEELVEQMTKKYSDQIAYIWISNESPNRLHIAATTNEALVYAKSVNPDVETHMVKYSYDEMESIHQQLTDLLYGGFDRERKCFAAFKPEELKIYLGLIDLTEDQKRSAEYKAIQQMVTTYSDLIELSDDTSSYVLASET